MAVSTGSKALYSDLTNWYTVFNNLSQNFSSGITTLSVPASSSIIQASDINNLNNKITEFQQDYWLSTQRSWWPSNSDVTVGNLITPQNISGILTVVQNASLVKCRNIAKNTSGDCQYTNKSNTPNTCGTNNSACTYGDKGYGTKYSGTEADLFNGSGHHSNGTNSSTCTSGEHSNGTCTCGTDYNATNNCGSKNYGRYTSGSKTCGTNSSSPCPNGVGYPSNCTSGCPNVTQYSGTRSSSCTSGSKSCGIKSCGTHSSKYYIPCSSGKHENGNKSCGTNTCGICTCGAKTVAADRPCPQGVYANGQNSSTCTCGTKQFGDKSCGTNTCGTNTYTRTIDITCVNTTKTNWSPNGDGFL